jgi:hypothetical protein
MRSSIVLIAGALAIFAGPLAQPAHADSKDEFKKGCESSRPPGSFVENVDNVQCNTSGGTTITCDKSIKQCGVASLGPEKPCTPGVAHRLDLASEVLGLSCQPIVVRDRTAPSGMGLDHSDPAFPGSRH